MTLIIGAYNVAIADGYGLKYSLDPVKGLFKDEDPVEILELGYEPMRLNIRRRA